MTIVLVHGNPETEAIWDDLVPHLPMMMLFVCLHPDLAPQSQPALTVPLTLIATGSPANSRSCHNRSISSGMTGAADTSLGSQWNVQI